MTVLDQLASAQGGSDEEPNVELAQKLAGSGDAASVRELVEALAHSDRAIRHDAIKVLYELGSLRPDLIEDHTLEFVNLLKSRDNRMVWGGMTALGSIADRRAADLWPYADIIMRTTEDGSVITRDWGIRVLTSLSAADPEYEARLFPFLMDFLRQCRPKDVPRHAESIVPALTVANQAAFLAVLEKRLPSLTNSGAKRIQKIIRARAADQV